MGLDIQMRRLFKQYSLGEILAEEFAQGVLRHQSGVLPGSLLRKGTGKGWAFLDEEDTVLFITPEWAYHYSDLVREFHLQREACFCGYPQTPQGCLNFIRSKFRGRAGIRRELQEQWDQLWGIGEESWGTLSETISLEDVCVNLSPQPLSDSLIWWAFISDGDLPGGGLGMDCPALLSICEGATAETRTLNDMGFSIAESEGEFTEFVQKILECGRKILDYVSPKLLEFSPAWP